jgi:hypothetical protein
MTFKSRKDNLYRVVMLASVVLLCGVMIMDLFIGGVNTGAIGTVVPALFVSGLLLWIWFGTWYKLEQGQLLYKSGPLKGRIPVKSIRKIVKGKTLWAGFKPALARKGLIIKYGRGEQIYISPSGHDAFLAEIKKMNPGVEIVTAS